VKLARLYAQLGPQDQLLVRDLLAVLGGEPVVAAVVRDVEDLLAESKITANFPRAIKVLPKAGLRTPGPPKPYR